MKNSVIIILIVIFLLDAETLFEVKDASNNPVLNVSTDGLRILNEGDTLMVISSQEIKANIGASGKGLSRSFSVTTTQSKGSGSDLMRLTSDSTRFWISDDGSGFGVSSQSAAKNKSVATNFLKVSNENTQMREGVSGNRYTDFSPDNIFIGLNSGLNSRPGQVEPYYGKYNTFLGNESGYSNTYGFGNIFIGYQAGFYSTTSNQNISIGYQAGYNMTGQSNTLVGHLVGKGSGSGGDYNSFYGRAAGFNIGSASSNTLIGALSGSALTNGSSNTLIGKDAGKGQTGAAFSYNTVLGTAAATQLSTGGNNVIIGYNSGYSLATGTGNIFIGKQAGGQETGSDKLYIENSSSTTPLIYGDFAADEVKINGTLYTKTLQIADMGSYNLGLNGDIVPYLGSTGGYDLGNNVAGEYWDDVVALEYITYSDRDTKEDIKAINRGLSDLMKLRPVSYRYKKDISSNDKLRLGFIAQEVENVIPEAVVSSDVDRDPETGEKIITKGQYQGMNYDQLIPVLIKAVQEQQAQIEHLQMELDQMKVK